MKTLAITFRLLLTILLFSSFVKGQNQTTIKKGITNRALTVQSAVTGLPSTFLQWEAVVYITSAFKQEKSKYFEIYHGKDKYVIEAQDLDTEIKFDELLDLPKDVKDSLESTTKNFVIGEYNRLERERKSILSAHRIAGLTILKFFAKDESEYTDGTSLQIEVFNPTQKIIKYIWFSFTGINPVGDKVITDGTSLKTVRAIGPIEVGKTASYYYEYVWLTDVVETANLSSIKIQYMDGTTKMILRPKSIMLSKKEAKLILPDS